jgi:hypothetical protein
VKLIIFKTILLCDDLSASSAAVAYALVRLLSSFSDKVSQVLFSENDTRRIVWTTFPRSKKKKKLRGMMDGQR